MPDLHGNLLSVAQLTSQGVEIRFIDHFCRIFQNGEITCEGMRQGDLYIMDTKTIGVARAYVAQVSDLPKEGDELDTGTPIMSTGSKATLRTWHRRLGHLHSEAILQMACKGIVRGMEISRDHGETKICQPCLDSKQTCTKI